jgi:hypothetical protein
MLIHWDIRKQSFDFWGTMVIYIEGLPWKPPIILSGFFFSKNQLPFKKMVCNLGLFDSVQELDLTSRKKKITRELLAKFRSEKYDFNWYKGTSWNKWPKLTRFQWKKFQISRHLNFSLVARNVEGIFIFSYLVCSKIWISLFLHDHHFGYISEMTKETLDLT